MLSEFHVPRTICESVPAGHTHGNTNQGGQGASAIISSLTVFGPTLVRSHQSYLRLLDTVRVFASSHGCCPRPSQEEMRFGNEYSWHGIAKCTHAFSIQFQCINYEILHF